MTDHFWMDRAMLDNARESLADICVTLGEWVADNTLGDPLLQPAMLRAEGARGAAWAASMLLLEALKLLPLPDEEDDDSNT